MQRPRILLTTSTVHRESGLRREDSLTGRNYSQAVTLAGGLPLMVANLDPELADACLDGIDGVLFTGGVDIDPEFFGREPDKQLGRVDPGRDEFELALYRAARARGLPILGICRGIQLVNVAEGGTLHQHLPAQREMVQHDQVDIGGAPSHAVTLEQGSQLAKRLGRLKVRANSYHHQGIEQLASGLRAVAKTADGLIEVIESTTGAPLLAVQWHPEMSYLDYPEHLLPFEWLIEAARRAEAAEVGGLEQA